MYYRMLYYTIYKGLLWNVQLKHNKYLGEVLYVQMCKKISDMALLA